MTAESVMISEALGLAHQEKDLLETMVLEHSRLVYRIGYSVLRNEADAEDVTQETFLRASRHRVGLARVDDRRAWLARIAWRVAIERSRQEQRRQRQTVTDSGGVVETLPASGTGTDALLLEQERSNLLERLIAGLPSQLRDPLVLSAIEEVSTREIASVLGITEAAVRSRAFRARQILRERFLALTNPRK